VAVTTAILWRSQVQHLLLTALRNHVVIVKIRIGRVVQWLQLLLLNALQNERRRRRRGFSFKRFNKYAFVCAPILYYYYSIYTYTIIVVVVIILLLLLLLYIVVSRAPLLPPRVIVKRARIIVLLLLLYILHSAAATELYYTMCVLLCVQLLQCTVYRCYTVII